MNWRRQITYGALLLAGYLAVCCAAGVFVAEGTLHPGRRLLTEQDRAQAVEMAGRHDSVLRDVSVVADDGITLRAWSIRPKTANGQTVILLHGLSDNRIGMIGYAEMLITRGYSVLLPDARAHGASDGAVATYGLLERHDVHRWAEWVREHEASGCIFGFGESMGAAQLLQSLAVEDHFCAVGAESPFASLREIAYDRVGQFFGVGAWMGRWVLRPVVEVAFAYTRWRYGLELEGVSPDRVVAATRVPVLLIHGKQDSNIPVRHSRMIAADNKAVVLWEVDGADHCGAISVAATEFERRVVGWFDGTVWPRSRSTSGAALTNRRVQPGLRPRPVHDAVVASRKILSRPSGSPFFLNSFNSLVIYFCKDGAVTVCTMLFWT